MATECVYIINPSIPLALVAERIGAAIGAGLELETSGRFEEYPAFVGATSDLEITLLGIPRPEDDIRENPTQDYALQVAAFAKIPNDRYLELHQQLLAGGIEILSYELSPNNSFKPTAGILSTL